MIRIFDFDKVAPEEILNRDIRAEADVEAVVDGIIADVRRRGDEALRDYARRFDHAELDSLRGQTLDLAFIPLDPRQQDNAWWGFADFLKACPCRYVFPMHYADNKPGMLAYLKQPALAPWLDCIHTEDCWQGPQR